MFAWYELRAIDPEGARVFYADTLGLHFRDEGGRALLDLGRVAGEITELPEVARTRGAPPHWLGHLSVSDVDAALTAMNGVQLGPERNIDGYRVVGVRDPSGVPVALTDRPLASPLAWHELHGAAPDPLAPYRAIAPLREVGEHELPMRYTLWTLGPAAGGAMASAHLPGVHPHWEHYFAVADMETARASIHRCGGRALPARSFDGRSFAVAHDPWGASFGLCEAAQDRSPDADLPGRTT